MAYQPKNEDLAEFALIGWRHSDEKLVIGATDKKGEGTTMENFPKEVELLGNVYELEYVEKQGDGLEWGFYC